MYVFRLNNKVVKVMKKTAVRLKWIVLYVHLVKVQCSLCK